MAKAMFKDCDKCGKSLPMAAFYPTKNIMFPNGTLNICRDCVKKMLQQSTLEDGHCNLEFADSLCQWADIPFNPNEWIKLYETNQENTFDVYQANYFGDNRADVCWLDVNRKWKEIVDNGYLDDNIEVLSAGKLQELKARWGYNYDEEQLQYLEQLYQGILQTQNVNGKLQVDQAIKLCKVSLLIDEKIREGSDFKNLLDNYNKLVAISDFTPKNAKNANDFDSAAEIFAYLERKGWKNEYYDGVERDIVDKSMKNIQGWIRNLYINETSISDDIAQKIEALKIAKQLIGQVDDYEEYNETDDYTDGDYDIDEGEFNPNLI